MKNIPKLWSVFLLRNNNTITNSSLRTTHSASVPLAFSTPLSGLKASRWIHTTGKHLTT